MLKHQHKTLAKTLDYIIRRCPGEHGLFWDMDGTMPWKDFYWALQEDPALRFVRESTVRELILLGIELPFVLEQNLLRLRAEFGPPFYPVASEVPKRLYFAIKPRSYATIQQNGLRCTRRALVALCAERELALRIARRNEPSPILVEILAREAFQSGLSFLVGGEHLYLVESVPVEFILFPKVRVNLAEKLPLPPRKPKLPPSLPTAAGSFTVSPRYLEAVAVERSEKRVGATRSGSGRQGAKSAKQATGSWKKEGRKERHKREI
jgi:putative RNA 2'-phosphotransferase